MIKHINSRNRKVKVKAGITEKLGLVCMVLVFALFTGCTPKPLEEQASSVAKTNTLSSNVSDRQLNVTDEQYSAFKATLYPVLVTYCSACHSSLEKPNFAHEDLAIAYYEVISNSLVSFNISASRLVNKPLSQHMCTGMTCQTWSDAIEAGVTSWGVLISGGGSESDISNVVVDVKVDNVDVDDSVVLVDNSNSNQEQLNAFKSNLYPTLVEQCSQCHANIVTPKFAHDDVATAYFAVTSNTLVNLSNSENSRLVKKPLTLHKCTQPTCQVWSDNIKTGIENWSTEVADSATGSGIVGRSVESSMLTLADGVKDEGMNRVEDAIIAKYEFKTGSGQTAFDTSGVMPALDLTLSEDVNWMSGRGIDITDPNENGITKAVATQEASKKLYNRISGPNGSREYSVETWLINASVALDGPARIVSYSKNSRQRNFTLGQNTSYYNFRNRTDLTGDNGTAPSLETNNDADDLKRQLQHVVITFDETNGRNIYVNGYKTSYEDVDSDPAVPANLSNWDDSYTFILGNEVSDSVDRQWLGKILFVAVHERALTGEEILNNALEGIGDKFIMNFDVSDLLDSSGSSESIVSVVVSELDEFSYVFATPTLLTNIMTPNIPVKNIRISVNGNIPSAAQTFRNIDLTAISGATELSSLGAVIPKDLGSDADEFSLVFEVLGNNSNAVVEQDPPSMTPNLTIDDPSPEFGLRTFGQINNTMALLTGVNQSEISQTYKAIEQQLPGTPNLGSFVSSHQIGIAKLSLEYCDAMVESSELRTNFFGNTFDFTLSVSDAFADQAKRDIVIQNVVNRFVGAGLDTQPELSDIQPELDQLIDELSENCNVIGDCDEIRTRTIVKSVCAAVLASAAVSIN